MLATRYHAGQFRKWAPVVSDMADDGAGVAGGVVGGAGVGADTRVPYIVHPLRVAVLAGRYVSSRAVAAAVCHDLLEDTDCPREAIRRECGDLVLDLVVYLTNEKDALKSRRRRKADERVRLSCAPWAARVIKACDRIDNLGGMQGAPEDFRDRYAVESERLLGAIGKDLPSDLREAFLVAIG